MIIFVFYSFPRFTLLARRISVYFAGVGNSPDRRDSEMAAEHPQSVVTSHVLVWSMRGILLRIQDE